MPMATNKNAQIRYKILDNCFRNKGKRYFIEDLIEECNQKLSEIYPDSNGISRRQIFDDIRFMESSEGWKIDLLRLKEGRKFYYRYADSSFSINNMPLSESEINRMLTTLQTFSQFKGLPQFEWMSELLPKLKQGNNNVPSSAIMEFENNQDLKGIEHIGTLYDAIVYKKVLKITYLQSFKDKMSYEIHPYFLKQYNNRWFLFGLNPESSEKKPDWNLPLDRIIEIDEINKTYIPNTIIDWNDYFDNIIGVTKLDNATEKITLHFFGKTGHYISSNPVHPYQKHKWLDSETLEVNLELIINFELERLICSYAEFVKVIQPHSLAVRIKKRLQTGAEQY